MREQLTGILRCPACHSDGALALAVSERDGREVRGGMLTCAVCARAFAVSGGIAELMPDPPEFVRRERDGLERFARVMREDGWDAARIRALPDVELPYWHGQRKAIDALLARADLRPGQRILDVGANTCWAAKIFAARDLEVVALDISTVELQGLRTADLLFAGGTPHFERVLSPMFAPALADESFDHVFCCEVLHHNDPPHLRRTMRELHRLLRPGGRLWVVNEPLRFPLLLKRDHGHEVADFEGNEHVYFLHEYWLAARSAGFRVTIPGFARLGRGSAPRALARSLWRRVVRGDMPLAMDCAKRPLRRRRRAA